MKARRHAALIGISAAALASVYGCASVLGIDNEYVEDRGSGGASSVTSSSGSGGAGPACASKADCPSDTDCATYTCLDKQCQLTLAPAGTEVTAGKVSGDCKRKVCSGSGTVSEVNADDDPPLSPNPCTAKSCKDGEVITTIVRDNQPCGMNQYCQAGVCVGCQMAADCKPPIECSTVECTNEQCIYTLIPAGTEVEDTDPSDCMHAICNAGGMKQTVPDTTETPPSDGEVCTQDKCSAMGTAEYAPINQGGHCEPMSACADASTCENGACTKHPKPAGYLMDDGVDGNCKANYCDGNGNIVPMPDDNDEPQDDNLVDCLVPNCVNGTNVPIELVDGSACGPGGTRKCCNAVCCANSTDQCIENMCCTAAKICGNECCAANQTCSMLGDGGLICAP
jgi:hypothetical protein